MVFNFAVKFCISRLCSQNGTILMASSIFEKTRSLQKKDFRKQQELARKSFLENRLADEWLEFHVSWKKSESFAMNELDHWRILRIVSLRESLIFYIIWCSTVSQLVQPWEKSKSDKRVWKHLIRSSAGNCFTGKRRKNSSICFRPLCTVMSS